MLALPSSHQGSISDQTGSGPHCTTFVDCVSVHISAAFPGRSLPVCALSFAGSLCEQTLKPIIIPALHV